MLTKLHIRNYAIIEEIEISFKNGLTIITGETGAGKSILIGALSLILGERADAKSFLHQEEKCIIEGVFDITQIEQAKLYLQEQDIDFDDELIIRREINTNGKSRVFINDTPSTLNVLSALASMLIDLHRQFDTQELQHTSEQLSLVDEVCKNKTRLDDYRSVFHHWKFLQKEYHTLVEKNRLIKQEFDYHQFLYNELALADLKPDELETLSNELDILNNSEALKNNLQAASMSLKDNEHPVLAQLKYITQLLEPHAVRMPILEDIKQRIQTCHIELKEISAEIEDLFEKTNFDEARILYLNERLNEINRLLKKHGVTDSNALIRIQSELEEKLHLAVTADEHELALQQAIQDEELLVQKKALLLSEARKQSLPNIEQTVNSLLKKVGMPNASIRIEISPIAFQIDGGDKIEFLFDANKTMQYAPIAKVASGGELSRLMLCIKSLLAQSIGLPTLLFDEIDTGISGETALQVGNIMKELSAHHQLICITHLPQIASKANQHLYIYKEENNKGQIITHLKHLSEEQRVDVLAEMLSGKESSTQAKEMVKQLMK